MKIAEGIFMPATAVTQKMAWIGTSGGGKTYGAMRLAEEMYDAHAQFVVLDPVGVWYGLRLEKNGKKPSDISIPIFGGLHGDIPLEATSGKLMADLIVDKGITAILDVSQFESDAEKARFVGDFNDRLFFRKKSAPSAIHIFYEECQEFFPQNPQREENRMLHAGVRLQKIGRNFGIGTSLITQRPQEVSKKALNLAGTLFAFRTTGSHERKAIELWMQDNSVEEKDMVRELPSLETGCPHLWSPEWLKVSKVVRINEKRTFDASATPEVGAKAVTREMGEIDLEKIRGEMAATIEKANAEDPKVLRARIALLEREAKNGLKHRKISTSKALVEPNPQVIARAIAARDKEWAEQMRLANREIMRLVTCMNKATENLTGRNPLMAGNKVAGAKMTILVSDGVRPAVVIHDRHKEDGMGATSLPSDTPQGTYNLSKGARAVLSYLHQSYPHPKSKAQCWIATGYSPGGGFNNIIYELTGADLIQRTGDVKFIAVKTAAALTLLDHDFDSTSLKWASKLSTGAWKIFKLCHEDPDTIWSKEKLAEQTGYAIGGGFNNLIYELTGKELIQKVEGGYQVNPEVLDL